jgi:glyoxylase-like metal-dependent hydrolase (beta-lactamase superfamily II)
MKYRPYLFAGAVALSLAGAAIAQQADMDAVEITVQPIKPGVAVLFGFGGNIGVSHGEDGTIIVDDQFAPLTGKIQAAIAGMGASPVKYVVNTHWHFDHAQGNENFGKAGAIIVAQSNVRDRLIAGGTVMGNVAPPAPKEALPVLTYDHRVSFHQNGQTIDVIHTGGGHTDGDSVVFWREANVLHTGDMMMKDSGFPFIDLGSGGSVVRLIVSLDQMIAMTDAETVIIPGHGELATRSDLIAFRTMVATAVERVKALKDVGRTLDQAKTAKPLDGVRNANGFNSDDQFVEAIWGSLEAHGR